MPSFLSEATSHAVMRWLFCRVLLVGLSLEPANKEGRIRVPKARCYHDILTDVDSFAILPTGAVNRKEIRFPQPQEDWGVIQSVFVFDPSRGAMVCQADIRPRPITPGRPAQIIAVGALAIEWR